MTSCCSGVSLASAERTVSVSDNASNPASGSTTWSALGWARASSNEIWVRMRRARSITAFLAMR